MKKSDIIFCIVAALCVAINYIGTDIYLPAMPLLKSFFNTSTGVIQSTVTIFMVGIVLSQLISGPLADHYGFRNYLFAVIILFGVASVICAYSFNIPMLYLGRFLQALAAGGLAVVGRASFLKRFPQKQATYLYISIVPTVGVMSPTLAPAIGGFLTHHFHWQAIFIALTALAIILLVLIYFFYTIPKQKDVETSIHPIHILKCYGMVLKNKLVVIYIFMIIAMFAVYFAYMTETPFILHDMGLTTKEIGYSYITIGLGFLIANHLGKHLSAKQILSLNGVVTLGFICMLTSLSMLLIYSWLQLSSVIIIVGLASIYIGAMGFINPFIIGKTLSFNTNYTGYCSSLVGAAALIGAAIGTQSINALTGGSLVLVAFYSLVVATLTLIIFLYNKK